MSTTLTTGDAAKESHLIFSRISFVPGQLNGPARKPKFQVSLREANYKLIWGQVDTMLWNHSPLKIKLFQPQATMLHRGFRAAKKEGIDVDEDQVI